MRLDRPQGELIAWADITWVGANRFSNSATLWRKGNKPGEIGEVFRNEEDVVSFVRLVRKRIIAVESGVDGASAQGPIEGS